MSKTLKTLSLTAGAIAVSVLFASAAQAGGKGCNSCGYPGNHNNRGGAVLDVKAKVLDSGRHGGSLVDANVDVLKSGRNGGLANVGLKVGDTGRNGSLLGVSANVGQNGRNNGLLGLNVRLGGVGF